MIKKKDIYRLHKEGIQDRTELKYSSNTQTKMKDESDTWARTRGRTQDLLLSHIVPQVQQSMQLRQEIHAELFNLKNNAMITHTLLNDPSLSCPCKVHIDSVFSDGQRLWEWINKLIYKTWITSENQCTGYGLVVFCDSCWSSVSTEEEWEHYLIWHISLSSHTENRHNGHVAAATSLLCSNCCLKSFSKLSTHIIVYHRNRHFQMTNHHV